MNIHEDVDYNSMVEQILNTRPIEELFSDYKNLDEEELKKL